MSFLSVYFFLPIYLTLYHTTRIFIPASKGLYRYGISNCLFEATYEKVLEICRCTPYFHWAGMKKHRRFCRGPALVCMNQVFDRIGEYNEVTQEDGSNPSPNSNQTNTKIRKVSIQLLLILKWCNGLDNN